MKPELKQKWVEALRSGEYEQGRKVLRSEDNKFCCLGVLLDLCAPNGWSKTPIKSSYGNVAHTHRAADQDQNVDPSRIYVPKPDYRGLSGDAIQDIAAMNDGGTSFPEIAAYIEAHL